MALTQKQLEKLNPLLDHFEAEDGSEFVVFNSPEEDGGWRQYWYTWNTQTEDWDQVPTNEVPPEVLYSYDSY